MQVELHDLGLDQGGHLLIKRALDRVSVGETVEVKGTHRDLAVHLRAFCRMQGHELIGERSVKRGGAQVGRWRGAESTGEATSVVEDAPAVWGLAGRSATVEAGGPAFDFPLHQRKEIWAEEAAQLYAQAAAAQWDPAKAIPWDAPIEHPEEVEDAVVQVMSYLIENETAALVIPARFASQIHPHFREVVQLLAIQAADEARHIEVFTRRALLRRPRLGLSTVGGQASLKTLVDEPDFALASFMLSVLVAFGLAHLSRHVQEEPALLDRLAMAVKRRHDALANTAGLNEEVFDSLLLLSAGSWDPGDLRKGWQLVQKLEADMDSGRRKRLARLGFSEKQAAELSELHTKNFM
jgi:hypothetical protein